MRKSTQRYLLLGIIAVVVVVALYYAFDPERHPFPRCLFKQLTGWDCAGCGSQRMLHALLHGDIALAWHYNAGIIVGMPILLTMLIASLWRDKMPRLYSIINSRPAIILVTSAILAWGILRNIF